MIFMNKNESVRRRALLLVYVSTTTLSHNSITSESTQPLNCTVTKKSAEGLNFNFLLCLKIATAGSTCPSSIHIRATPTLLLSAPGKHALTYFMPFLSTLHGGTMPKYIGISFILMISSGGNNAGFSESSLCQESFPISFLVGVKVLA